METDFVILSRMFLYLNDGGEFASASDDLGIPFYLFSRYLQ